MRFAAGMSRRRCAAPALALTVADARARRAGLQGERDRDQLHPRGKGRRQAPRGLDSPGQVARAYATALHGLASHFPRSRWVAAKQKNAWVDSLAPAEGIGQSEKD